MNTIANPYVGPQPFKEEERKRFFGRTREARDLLALVLSQQLVVFYAQSGAGKSSLVNTSLIPDLRLKGFERYVGRVSGDVPPGIEIENIYVFNLLRSLAVDKTSLDSVGKTKIADFLPTLKKGPSSDPAARSQKEGDSKRHVLIVDQFEELFSTHHEAWEKREGFFQQLAEALETDPYLWVVLVMREDYIASLDPYAYLVPGRFRKRYYMQRLEKQAALEAVKKPVQDLRPYAEKVAENLVEDLLKVNVYNPDGTTAQKEGQYVEPVQLQVVCYNLWKELPPGGTQITQKDLREVGDVNTSLGKYYEDRVQAVSKAKAVSERKIREWFDSKLISPGGIRNVVLREPGRRSSALENEVIEALPDLIRAEQRGGSIFYELTHDRLVEPILTNNKNWKEKNTSPLQRQAVLWKDQRENESWLLTDQALNDVETWAKKHPDQIGEIEEEFLSACRRHQEQVDAEREAQRRELEMAQKLAEEQERAAQEQALANQRIRKALRTSSIIAGIASLLLLISIALGFQSYQNQRTTEMQVLINASSIEHQKGKKELAALLAYQALITYGDDHGEPEEALANITHPMDSRISFQAPFIIANTNIGVNSISFNPADHGQTFAVGHSDGNVYLVDAVERQLIGQPLTGHTAPVASVAFSPDGKTLASGSYDNTIILWDVATGQPIGQPLAGHISQITSVAFSPDGKTLASGSYDYTVILWDVETREPIGRPLTGHTDWVNSIAFSPDGSILASGGDTLDKTIILWDVKNQQQIGQPLTGHTYNVTSVAFSPDGKMLASGGGYDASIILWDVATRQQISEPLTTSASQVTGVAFSPDGSILASGTGYNASIILWDVATRQPMGEPLKGDVSEVTSLAFSPDGRTLASGGSSESDIPLWDVATRQTIGEPVAGLSSNEITPASALSLTGDANIMAVTGNTLILWDTQSQLPETGEVGGELDKPAYHLESIANLSPYAFSPDGNYRADGIGNSVIVTEVTTGQEISMRHGRPFDSVTAVAFSHDGNYVASGNNQTVQIWDAHSGKRIARIHLDGNSVSSMSFSPDGTRIAIAYGDERGIVEVWDVQSRQKVLWISDGQLQNLGYTVVSSNRFAGNQEGQNATGTDENQQAGNPVADILYAPEGLFILYHNGVVDRWDIWPSQAELKKYAEENLCGDCMLRYDQRVDYKLYTWPMQVTNIAGYLFAAVSLVGFGILSRSAYGALFARPDKPSETRGFSWKKMFLATAQGTSLISLTFLSWVFLNFSEMIFHDPFEVPGPEQTILWQLLLTLPFGLWAGGAYSHLTRHQTGKRSRTKRALVGMLAGLLSGTLAGLLGLAGLSYASARDLSIFSDSFTLVVVLIVAGASALMSLFGALLYIFGLQPWSEGKLSLQTIKDRFWAGRSVDGWLQVWWVRGLVVMIVGIALGLVVVYSEQGYMDSASTIEIILISLVLALCGFIWYPGKSSYILIGILGGIFTLLWLPGMDSLPLALWLGLASGFILSAVISRILHAVRMRTSKV